LPTLPRQFAVATHLTEPPSASSGWLPENFPQKSATPLRERWPRAAEVQEPAPSRIRSERSMHESTCPVPGRRCAGPVARVAMKRAAVASYALLHCRQLSRNGKGRQHGRDMAVPGKADTTWRCWCEIRRSAIAGWRTALVHGHARDELASVLHAATQARRSDGSGIKACSAATAARLTSCTANELHRSRAAPVTGRAGKRRVVKSRAPGHFYSASPRSVCYLIYGLGVL